MVLDPLNELVPAVARQHRRAGPNLRKGMSLAFHSRGARRETTVDFGAEDVSKRRDRQLSAVLRALVVILAAIGGFSPSCRAPIKHDAHVSLSRIDHVAMNVADLQHSFDWYHRLFGFEILHQWTHTWMIGTATMKLGLFHRPNATRIDDAELDSRLALIHYAFLTDADGFNAAKAVLAQAGESFEVEDTGIALSLFVRDPDSHQVEITTYH
jgi:catechol 2,3-dioxygenase-like lactoylglutathione lyase family enzyme